MIRGLSAQEVAAVGGPGGGWVRVPWAGMVAPSRDGLALWSVVAAGGRFARNEEEEPRNLVVLLGSRRGSTVDIFCRVDFTFFLLQSTISLRKHN